jgi:beta-1,4-mannosyltransferase
VPNALVDAARGPVGDVPAIRNGSPARRVATIPAPPTMNPYLLLLYEELERHGFQAVTDGELRLGWLWQSRGRIDLLHFNWPQGLYRHQRGPARLRRPLSWVKLALFGARLVAARALGYRIAWTVHQVYPHDTTNRLLDRAAGIILANACDVILAHDESTAKTARADLGRACRNIQIVPHGSYVGVYPLERTREAVREEHSIPAAAFAFLCFGELRRHKDVDLLLEGFAKASLPEAALIVAGSPTDADVARQLVEAAAADARVKPLLRFVPTEEVAELFAASDAAVVARSDGGTSGALVLALSLGLPVVVADRPAYRELIQGERAGWLFDPGNVDAVSLALERAAADAGAARAKGREAAAIAAGLRWPEIAARTAGLFEAALR